jgi:membrane dipeptidase
VADDVAQIDAIRAEQNRPREISDDARRLLRESCAVDMTQPILEGNLTEHRVLERARAAGFGFVSVTVDHGSDVVHSAIEDIARIRRYVTDRTDDFVFVRDYADILRAKESDRTGVGIHFQDTDPVNGNLDLVWLYRDLGISHMLLAYNRRNLVADGCAERTDGGLSRFGQALVAETRRAGILCDGSHTGYRSSMEAMELYDGPFIFSHSNCKAVFDHYRNIADDQIIACAQTGGVVGINGVGRFLDDPFATAESMFRHVDHVVSLVGWQHVGIGLDRMADPDRMWRWLHENAGMWPGNQGRALQYATYAPHDAIGEVVDLMIAHGYPENAIRGYLGVNFLRVLEAVWGTSAG